MKKMIKTSFPTKPCSSPAQPAKYNQHHELKYFINAIYFINTLKVLEDLPQAEHKAEATSPNLHFPPDSQSRTEPQAWAAVFIYGITGEHEKEGFGITTLLRHKSDIFIYRLGKTPFSELGRHC